MNPVSDGYQLQVNNVMWRVRNPSSGSYLFERVDHPGVVEFEAGLSNNANELNGEMIRELISDFMSSED